MIECKTWGEEYAKARNDLLEDGGQLFSYFVQERKTRALYLYASKITDSAAFHTEFLSTDSIKGDSNDELFRSWDQVLHLRGLFREDAKPYESDYANLTFIDLQELDRSAGRGLFNSFAETLRRHTLSDKGNAFNKIFNLFVCKIADEDAEGDADDEPEFQWKVDDTVESLLDRLSELYRRGLKDYLEIDVEDDFFSPVAEFAFLDVFDKKSYARNGHVVREVVQLLQSYRLKYSARHQFLGDFFEILLNTGVKQESGQFFTPVPLARFIIRSLPLQDLIDGKIERRSSFVLPYVLDYACGSGHFLTEAIDEVQGLASQIDVGRLTRRATQRLSGEMKGYLWTREYVYGIEQDYRLAKTTKIATFMNGDGDATIIRGDGLDDFFRSTEYRGLLKADRETSVHETFDVIVSNPPFAVPHFLTNVASPAKNFELAKYLGADSSEIEALFIERSRQALLPGGVLGVILPLSILNGRQSVYSAARSILLLDFEIMGLVELREKAFIESTSATICLFARRREREVVDAASADVEAFFTGDDTDEIDKGTMALLGGFEESFPSLAEQCREWYADAGDEDCPLAIEAATAYVLNAERTVVLGFSGDKRGQEAFLGYRFSTGRGKEGIHWLEDDAGHLSSMLYDERDTNSLDKLSTHIRAVFSGQTLDLPDSLTGHAAYVRLGEIVDFENLSFENPSAQFEDVEIRSYSPFGDFIGDYACSKTGIAELLEDGNIVLLKGLVYDKSDEVPFPTGNKVLTADNIDIKTGRLVDHKFRYLKASFAAEARLRPVAGDVVMSIASGSLRQLGKVAFVNEDVDGLVGGFLQIIRATSVPLAKALYYNFLSKRFREFVYSLKDQNISNLPPHALRNFVLWIPKDLDAFEKDCRAREKALDDLEKLQKQLKTH